MRHPLPAHNRPHAIRPCPLEYGDIGVAKCVQLHRNLIEFVQLALAQYTTTPAAFVGSSSGASAFTSPTLMFRAPGKCPCMK